MGKFDFQFDQELTRQLERLGNYDEIANKILREAVPILERHVQSEVAKHKKTGDLYKSIKAGKPSKNKYGWYASVFPTGESTQYTTTKGTKTRNEPMRNAEKLVYMEYGTSTEPATPVLTKATKDAEPKVTEKMQEAFNREVDIS